MSAVKTAAHWLTVCRSHAFQPHQIKTAELGGGQDTPFEQAFSNLAHAYLKDKAPKLLDYEVGFQLLEKNQENTKAVGVFGFKVGSQWIYCPVFFLNGDLKGHELMYIKSQDLFVPLKEEWIDYILGKKPASLGSGVNRNLSMIGVMPPNLYQLSRSPQKFASDQSVKEAAARVRSPRPDIPPQPQVQPDPNAGMNGRMVDGRPAISNASMGMLQRDATQQPMSQASNNMLWADSQQQAANMPRMAAIKPPQVPGPPPAATTAAPPPAAAPAAAPPPAPAAGGASATPAPPTMPKIGAYMPKLPTWAREFLPVLGYLTTEPVSYEGIRGVPDLLKEAGEPTFRFLVEQVGTQYPAVLASVDRLYGENMLTDVARTIAQQKRAAASTSLVKDAAVMAFGDKPPSGWNGTMQAPSKLNGGARSDGEEAWDLSHVGRRFVSRHGGAQRGHLGEMANMKQGNYPGCGMGPKGPKGRKRRRMKKRASIIPSLIGPMEALPEGVKHRVISKEMVDLNPEVVHSMSSDERQTLLKQRVVYRDTREKKDVTIAYDVQTPLKLQNPDHTGIFYVLTKPDKFEKCLVVMHPYNHRQRLGFCTVVRLEGKKDYVNAHPASIWVRGEADNEAWKKWLDGLEDANSVPLQKRDKKYGGYDYDDKRCHILLGPTGEGTCPFRAREEYAGGNDESVVYKARFEDCEDTGRPAYLPDHGRNMRDPYSIGDCCYSGGDGESLTLTKMPGTKIRVNNGHCQVPDKFKILTIRDGEDAKDEPIRLGTLLDVQIVLTGHTTPLRIVSDGKDVEVGENRMDKKAAIIHLFYDHGLTKEAAEEIVDRATKKGKCEVRLIYPEYMEDCWDLTEKMAIDPGNDMIRGAPNAPPFPEPNMGYDPLTGGNIPTMQESEYNVKVPDMSASKTDRSQYYPFGPDPKSMQIAQQAAGTGQKEVFDTAMLGGLLKTIRQDNMVDKYMGDLMKGEDRLGRIIFLYYWHGEEFEDRYGKQDMTELEDGLRNAFEGLGDIILSLKRKGIDPQMQDDAGRVDLGPVANQ